VLGIGGEALLPFAERDPVLPGERAVRHRRGGARE
jgi:hypothetical protein